VPQQDDDDEAKQPPTLKDNPRRELCEMESYGIKEKDLPVSTNIGFLLSRSRDNAERGRRRFARLIPVDIDCHEP